MGLFCNITAPVIATKKACRERNTDIYIYIITLYYYNILLIIILCALDAIYGKNSQILACVSGLGVHYIIVKLLQRDSVAPPIDSLNTRHVGVSFA